MLYQSEPFPSTHPRHLCAVARLFGMSPAPVSECTVLELGCCAGNNIIPIAYNFPKSKFVGIDISELSINIGKCLIEELGIKNISLEAKDLASITQEFGKFDYIIAHGVLSWVKRPLQDKILEICSKNLAPQGVAYVSYNTYPGWHMRMILRDMLLFHTRGISEPEAKVKEARALGDFYLRSAAETKDAFTKAISEQWRVLRKFPDWYIYHDILEEVNEPVYFHDFLCRAGNYGLQYLGDSDVHKMTPQELTEDVQKAVRKISGTTVALEQYFDFFRNEMFRRTLLCHETSALSRETCIDRLPELFISGALEKVKKETSSEITTYRGSDGVHLETSDSLLIAALNVISLRWPETLSFSELVDAVNHNLKNIPLQELKQELSAAILKGFLGGVLQIHSSKIECTGVVSKQPMVNLIARTQALTALQVTNEYHAAVIIDDFAQAMILLLDGTKTVDDLVSYLAKRVRSGEFKIEDTKEEEIKGISDEMVKASIVRVLNSFAKEGLLK